MATTENEVPSPLPPLPVTRRVAGAIGMDRDLNARMWLAVLVTGACVALAPLPFSVIGILGLLVLTLEMGRVLWKHKP